MTNNFYTLYRKLRIAAIALGILIVSMAQAHVIDIEFHGPERYIQDLEHEDNRGRDEYERRSKGEDLSDREIRDAVHYERGHMV